MERRAPKPEPTDRDRNDLDRRHESDRRGEHRYDDAHQRPAERRSRQDRDDLKEKLGRDQ